MTLLQIIGQSTVSANWLFGSLILLSMVVIGFLLKWGIQKQDEHNKNLYAMLKEHDSKLDRHETEIEVLKYKDGETLRLSREILSRIESFNGGL